MVSEETLAKRMEMFPLEEYSLTDFFLLSDSPGERLAAVLALARSPRVEYLHWLSERIAVEAPFVGLRAAGVSWSRLRLCRLTTSTPSHWPRAGR